MPGIDPCRDEILKAMGRDPEKDKLSKNEDALIARHAGKLKARIDAGGDPATVLKNFAEERAEAGEARKLKAAQNILADAKADGRLEAAGDFGTKAPGQVFQSMWISSLKQFQGAYDFIGRGITRAANQVQGTYRFLLDQEKLTDYAFKGSDQKNIWRALDALNKDKDPSQFGANAAKVAGIIKKQTDGMWLMKKDANIPVGKLDDWAGPQIHDQYAVGRAGGNRLGSDAAAQQWIKDVQPNIDWDKTFGGELLNASDSLKTKRLRELWTQFTSGEHITYGGGTNLKNRELHFKDVDAQFDYNQKYGGGRSLAENVDGWLGLSARDVEIAKTAGSDPTSFAQRTSNRWMQKVNADESLTAAQKAKALKDLGVATDHAINRWIPALTGALGGAETALSHFAYNANTLINSMVVGAATPTLLGDIPLAMNNMTRFGGKAMQGYFNQISKGGNYLIGVGQADVRKLAAMSEIALQDMTRPLSHANMDQPIAGAINTFQQNLFKYAGHTDATDRIRTNMATVFGAFHWFERNKAWADLDPAVQNGFERFNIGPQDWDMIRKQQPEQVLSDTHAFGPAAIRRMDREQFRSVAGKDASDAMLRQVQNGIADKYRNFIGDMADRTTTSTSEELRAITLVGTKANSLPGFMVRMFNGLKSFTYNLTRNHYGAMIAGDRNPENIGMATLVKNFVQGTGGEQGGRVAMTKFIANNAAFGALIFQLGLLRNGEQPIIPDTPEKAGELLWKGFLRQGAGMYGELLMGQLDRPDQTAFETLGRSFAPMVGDAADLFDATKRVAAASVSSDPDKLSKAVKTSLGQLTRTGYGMVPGSQFVWTKFATDWYIKDNLLDAINPGYKERLTQKAQKAGTPYLLGPK